MSKFHKRLVHAMNVEALDAILTNLLVEDVIRFFSWLLMDLRASNPKTHSMWFPILMFFSESDCNAVMEMLARQGTEAAVSLLLVRLPRMKKSWLQDFIEAVRETDPRLARELSGKEVHVDWVHDWQTIL